MNDNVQRYFSAWPNENRAGYARAVRVDSLVIVAGTTATDGDVVVAPGDMFAQAMFVLGKIESSLEQAGANLRDVVSTRAYLTRDDGFEDFARAHRHFFDLIRPTNTTVAVSAFADSDMLIEIEAVAIIGSGDERT